jgi:SNF2 family DNA or RNA helicase
LDQIPLNGSERNIHDLATLYSGQVIINMKRKQKRKKSSKERQKKRRLAIQRERRMEDFEFFAWNAEDSFMKRKYDQCLKWASKALKIHPNDPYLRGMAIESAASSDKIVVLYGILLHAWENNVLYQREELIMLSEIALKRKDYHLARNIYHFLLNEELTLSRPLTKVQKKMVEQHLEYLDTVSPQPARTPREIEKKESIKRTQESGKADKSSTTGEEAPATATMEAADKSPPASEPEPDKKQRSSREANALEQQEPISKTKSAEQPACLPESEPAVDSLPAEDFIPVEEEPDPELTVEIDIDPVLSALKEDRRVGFDDLDLALQAYRLAFHSSYDQLLCLPMLEGVRSLWYQEETAKKIMKTFRGRAILADEVGLGKTIEACMVLKEYLLRGLIRTALILTPPNLVNQWQEELTAKFHIRVATTNQSRFRKNPEKFWRAPLILASINIAKRNPHYEWVTSRSYDLVIVDEAHHLKNRSTMNWKLINNIPKTYLLLLTATPVQNKLEELFNLVTLLRPGHLKTRKSFIQQFVARGNPTDPQNREKLRELLREVMLRNTRSVARLQLPPRFATTIRVMPSAEEGEFYRAIDAVVASSAAETGRGLERIRMQKLLEAAGSSHIAALNLIKKAAARSGDVLGQTYKHLQDLARAIDRGNKTRRLLELLRAAPDQKIVFVNYLNTLKHLSAALRSEKIEHVVYAGSLDRERKRFALESFQEGCPVMLSTGTGGEGHNLQFCHVMINFDLPWNPMEIEQRIGRIHRIGQENEVQVFNFCSMDSIEDHILEVLDKKINMFELVIGEIDMILGRLQDEREFRDMVYEIWIGNQDAEGRKQAFNALAKRLKRARSAYENSKELDEKIFQEDFGV